MDPDLLLDDLPAEARALIDETERELTALRDRAERQADEIRARADLRGRRDRRPLRGGGARAAPAPFAGPVEAAANGLRPRG